MLRRILPILATFTTLLLFLTAIVDAGQVTSQPCAACKFRDIGFDRDVVAPELLTFPAPIPAGAAAGSGIVPSYYLPPERIVTGYSRNYASHVADMNNDGLSDLLVTEFEAPDLHINIYHQTVSGTFAAPVTIPAVQFTQFMATGDFNGDGLPDLVYEQDEFGHNCRFALHYQNPDGSFSQPITQTLPNTPGQPVAADFNNDARDDLAMFVGVADTYIYTQTISGTLSAPLILNDAGTVNRLLLQADMNDDTRADIVRVAIDPSNDSLRVAIHAQTDTGFAPANIYSLDYPQLKDAATGDLNDDGLTDMVIIANAAGQREILVLTQTLSGTLTLATTFTNSSTESNVAIGDVDQDGRNDIILTQEGNRRVAVHYQSTAGTFAQYELFENAFFSTFSHHGLTVLDLGSNGLPDIVVADNGGDLFLMRHSGQIYNSYFSLLYYDLETAIYDDFSDPNSGWPIATTPQNVYGYLNGAYQIKNLTDTFSALATAGHLRRNYNVVVDVRKVGEAQGGYGIVYHMKDDLSEFLIHLVWPDQGEIWALIYRANSGFTLLASTTNPAIVHPGLQINELRVIHDAGDVYTYVNGHLIHRIAPGPAGKRRIGFFTAPLQANFDTRFDNYAVTIIGQ